MKLYFLSAFLQLSTLCFSFQEKENFDTRLQQKLSNFVATKSGVIIHATFHQPRYALGDTAFFKLYLLTSERQLCKGRNTVSLVLLDSAGKAVLNRRILTTDGTGHGQFILSENFHAGVYLLRCYTDEALASSRPSYHQQFLLVSAGKKLTINPHSSLQVFPEGGNCVEGLPTTFVISGMDSLDSANIVDNSERVVATVHSSLHGLAKFSLTPKAGMAYSIFYTGKSIPIGEPRKDGVGLTITYEGAHPSHAILRILPNSSLQYNTFYLSVTQGSKICSLTPVSFKSENTLAIPLLPDTCCCKGLINVTLFTENFDVVSERLLYVEPFEPLVTIRMKKRVYGTREQVELGIAVADLNGKLIPAHATITVYPANLFGDDFPSAITEDILRVCALDETNIPSLDSYTAAELDQYLVTQHPRFSWADIFNNEVRPTTENNPYYFKGKLHDRGQSIQDSLLLTFWLNSEDLIHGVYTNRQGEFSFPLFANFGDNRVLYKTTDMAGNVKNVKIELNNTIQKASHMPIRSYRVERSMEKDAYAVMAGLRSAITASYQYFSKPKSLTRSWVNRFDDPLETDHRFSLKKYKPFLSVQEMLKEAVPFVRTKKTSEVEIRLFMKESAMFAQGEPLLVIDGILTDSVSFLLKLDPSIILTIGVINSQNRLRRYGALGKYGILVVETDNPESTALLLQGRGALHVTGIHQPLPFWQPVYPGIGQQRIPDLRTILYWNPEAFTRANDFAAFSFFTGDGIGKYQIRIEGILENGSSFVHQETVEVRKEFNN